MDNNVKNDFYFQFLLCKGNRLTHLVLRSQSNHHFLYNSLFYILMVYYGPVSINPNQYGKGLFRLWR